MAKSTESIDFKKEIKSIKAAMFAMQTVAKSHEMQPEKHYVRDTLADYRSLRNNSIVTVDYPSPTYKDQQMYCHHLSVRFARQEEP